MQFDFSILIVVALFVATFVIIRQLPRRLAGVPFVPPSELLKAMGAKKDILIIDVRTNNEFRDRLRPVRGAVNIPVADLPNLLKNGDKRLGKYRNKPIYLMCLTTTRSPHAARYLRQAGFADVKVVEGGLTKWIKEGYRTA